MYLRNFAEHAGRRTYTLAVRHVDGVDKPFLATPNNAFAVRGFYWGATADGVPHHDVEGLLTQLEGDAAPVLKAVLNAPEGALPERWPLRADERLHLAWWMAAQVLRTTRQRKRLEHVDADRERLEVPAAVADLASHNPHLHYLLEHLAMIAFALYSRPWGLGFSDMCLLTGDVPVVLLNAPDAKDQLAAATVCDVLLPLDPHRLLFLPGPGTVASDPRKRLDHRMKIPGGVGMALVQIVHDVADQFVAHHPRHDPWSVWKPSGTRQPAPWNGETHAPPMYSLAYDVLSPDLTVARHWLTEHPSPRTDRATVFS